MSLKQSESFRQRKPCFPPLLLLACRHSCLARAAPVISLMTTGRGPRLVCVAFLPAGVVATVLDGEEATRSGRASSLGVIDAGARLSRHNGRPTTGCSAGSQGLVRRTRSLGGDLAQWQARTVLRPDSANTGASSCRLSISISARRGRHSAQTADQLDMSPSRSRVVRRDVAAAEFEVVGMAAMYTRRAQDARPPRQSNCIVLSLELSRELSSYCGAR